MQESTNQFVIYGILSIATGRRYIGATAYPETRKIFHLGRLRTKSHFNKRMQRVYNQHGEADLVFEIHEIVNNPDMVAERENFWISHFDCFMPEKGFNVRQSGYNVIPVDEKQRVNRRINYLHKSIDDFVYRDRLREIEIKQLRAEVKKLKATLDYSLGI